MSNRIDIAWMVRTRHAIPGSLITGSLSWSCGGSPAGRIGYEADMRDLEQCELRLIYTRGTGAERESVRQVIRVVSTEPNYGGRRWWMICPYRYNRVGKLYLPNGGDRFAGRKAWRLAYNSQRCAARDRAFEKLFRLQRKLGGPEGWEAGLYRPKGMWQRTFERYFDRYLELDEECGREMVGLLARLGG